jgi:uncharacterized membrane protein
VLTLWAIAGLWIAFVLSHMVLSSHALRPRLVALLGERLFQGVYSLIAFAIFVPMVMLYMGSRHSGPQLWSAPSYPVVLWIVYAIITVAFILVVAGVITPSPTAVLGGPPRSARGVQRITRHPVFMGVGLWSLVHMIMNGFASDVIFFGGFVLLALLGSWHQDQRKRLTPDHAYVSFCQGSPFLPFTGPDTLKGLREISPIAILVGVGLSAALRYYHGVLFS